MSHAQKPDFVFRRNGPFKSARASVQSTTDSRGVRISGSNAGYTMFRGSVKGTGYPLHSPVFPSLPLRCVTACRHISTGLYTLLLRWRGLEVQISWCCVMDETKCAYVYGFSVVSIMSPYFRYSHWKTNRPSGLKQRRMWFIRDMIMSSIGRPTKCL